MKNIKKIVAAVLSVAMMSVSVVAFADTEATYDATNKVASLALQDADWGAAKAGDQMTVAVVPKTFDGSAAQIYYINQDEFGTAFNAIIANMGLKGEINPADYEVRIGGASLTTPLVFNFEDVVSVLYGDADNNGIVENTDATVILRFKAGWDNNGGIVNMANADADGNDVVENTDATVILRFKAGWDVTLGPVTE